MKYTLVMEVDVDLGPGLHLTNTSWIKVVGDAVAAGINRVGIDIACSLREQEGHHNCPHVEDIRARYVRPASTEASAS